MANILDGKKIAQKIRDEIKAKVASLAQKPKLVVILVGNNPGSEVYVRMKQQACEEVGIGVEVLRFTDEEVLAAQKNSGEEAAAREEASQKEKDPAQQAGAQNAQSSGRNELLEAEIKRLNADPEVTAILVQIPLPKGVDAYQIISLIDPGKDVDCLHPMNVGRLCMGIGKLAPATPRGCFRLLEEADVEIEGKNVVIVGRSNIVGRPLNAMFLEKDATVSSCHKYTRDLTEYTKQADILVVAAGHPRLITGEMIKEGAVILDVGITREEATQSAVSNGSSCRIVGDVDFESVKDKASVLTPVPGGVGPLTVAMLLDNIVKLADRKG